MKLKLAAMATGGTDSLVRTIEDFYINSLTMEKGDKYVDVLTDKNFLRANKNASFLSPIMYILGVLLIYFLWKEKSGDL